MEICEWLLDNILDFFKKNEKINVNLLVRLYGFEG